MFKIKIENHIKITDEKKNQVSSVSFPIIVYLTFPIIICPNLDYIL